METRPFLVCLICSFCSSDRGFAHREFFIPQSGFLQTPPHDGRPCLRLTVPTAKSVVDSHHQAIMRAEHTQTGVPAVQQAPLSLYICIKPQTERNIHDVPLFQFLPTPPEGGRGESSLPLCRLGHRSGTAGILLRGGGQPHPASCGRAG